MLFVEPHRHISWSLRKLTQSVPEPGCQPDEGSPQHALSNCHVLASYFCLLHGVDRAMRIMTKLSCLGIAMFDSDAVQRGNNR